MERYKEIVVRPYKTGDAAKIYSLFSQYTPYVRDDRFWVWINRIIGDASIIVVAEDAGRIVGHYAIVPRKIVIAGNVYKVGLGIHAFVAPEYKESISVCSISQYAYQIAKEQDYLFIYGFPNANYRLIQEKLERWNKVAFFNALELPVRDMVIDDSSLKMEEINEINFSDLFVINEFQEKSIGSDIRLNSDARYWLERYFLHPQKLYKIFKLEGEGRILGYVVIKNYLKNGLNYLHIIDYALAAPICIAELLQTVLVYSKSDTDIMSVWKGDSYFHQELVEFGFQETGFDTFFGVKFLDNSKSAAIRDTVLNFDNWRLVMGDSDAF